MNVLVTGAGGMLGSALVPAFTAAGFHVIATDCDMTHPPVWGRSGPPLFYLDVRDHVAVREAIKSIRPAFVAHLAAETDLERSDADPDGTYATNTEATRHVAQVCHDARVRLVYISTAGVFDGTKDGPYTEVDAPNPINTYGATKLAGEYEVERIHDLHYIVRAGWMVGGGPGKDHKFVAKMLDQIRAGQRTIYAVGDKLGTPTYTADFARTLLGLIETDHFGRYHMACEGEGSRYDVALHILQVLGLTGSTELIEVTSDHFANDYPSLRPRSESMRNEALDRLSLNLMRPWRDALQEYLLLNFADMQRVRQSA
jgi:dTDP-4-dehydrorhamnose reductase